FFSAKTFLHETLAYSDLPDFGLVSVLRSMPYFRPGNPIKLYSFDYGLLDATKRLFVLGYALSCLTLPFFRRESLARALMIPPLIFYCLYGGVGAQYLLWVLPFGILLRERIA